MTTILDTLKGINAYPVPLRSITRAAAGRGLDVAQEATQEVLQSKEYKLAEADILLWLYEAPDVSQGGQSYSFTDDQRASFRDRAYTLYRQWGDAGDPTIPKSRYGYKGSKL